MISLEANRQEINRNKNSILNSKAFLAVAAAGAFALGVASQAQAYDEVAGPPSIEAALEQPLAEVATNIGQVAPGEKTKILTVKEVAGQLWGPAPEEKIKRLSVARNGSKLNLNLMQEDKMTEVRLGSVFTKKYFPGWDGVEGDTVPIYSRIFPYLVSSDFITKREVSVQAVTKGSTKGKWRVLSNTVKMPPFDNFSIIPIENAPVPDSTTTEAELSDMTVAGYTGNARSGYAKNHTNKGQIKLKRQLTASEGKNLYVKVIQRSTPRDATKYGRQSPSKKTSIFGPFRGAKQAKSNPVDTSYALRGR